MEEVSALLELELLGSLASFPVPAAKAGRQEHGDVSAWNRTAEKWSWLRMLREPEFASTLISLSRAVAVY